MSLQKDNNDFEFDKLRIEDFGFSDQIIEVEHIARPVVAHEIGHFVGLLLNDRCVEPFGLPKLINFGKELPRFNYDWTDQIFRVLRHTTECDFYGQRGYEIDKYSTCPDTIRFLEKGYDLERFSWFIAFKLLGGIFQLLEFQRCNNTEITTDHFERIFSDLNDNDQENIDGAAGMDWTSVRMYSGTYQIPIEIIMEYRLALFGLISEFNFYAEFESVIEDYHSKNISEYTEHQLIDLQKKIISTINDFEHLIPMVKDIGKLNSKLIEAIV